MLNIYITYTYSISFKYICNQYLIGYIEYVLAIFNIRNNFIIKQMEWNDRSLEDKRPIALLVTNSTAQFFLMSMQSDLKYLLSPLYEI